MNPDVIVADPTHAREFRTDLIDIVRNAWPSSRLLLLSNQTEQHAIAAAFTHGCHSFVLKSEPIDTIRSGIEFVCRGGMAISLSVAAILTGREIRPDEHTAKPSLPGIVARGLSAREVQIIQLVARGHTDVEIGGLLGISARTVERHMANVLNKLNCRNRTQAVAQVIGTPPPLARKVGPENQRDPG